MGDDQHRPVLDQPGEGSLDQGLVVHVQRGGGLIQKEDGGVLQKGPGNGHPLPLPAGELAAVLPNPGVPALGELLGKLVAVGQSGCRQDLFVGGILPADADVFQNGVVEEGHVLKDDGIQGQEGLRVHLGNVHPPHGDPPLVQIPEPGGQPGDGGLSPARGPHQSGDLPLLGREGDVPEDLLPRVVGKAHVIEDDVAPSVGEGGGPLLDGVVQDLPHPGDVGAGADDGRQVLQRRLEGIIQPGGHQEEQEEGEHIQAPLDQQHRPHQRHCGDAQLQNQGRAHHKGRQGELVDDGPPLHSADLLREPGQVAPLGVAGLQVPEGLHALLDPIGGSHLGIHGFLVHPLLDFGRSPHNGEGHRQHP